MVFLSKNNKSSKKKFLIGFIGLLLMVAFYLGGLSFLTGPLHYAGKPLWWLKNYSFEIVSNFTAIIKTKETLSEENKELKIKLNQINSQYLFLKTLSEENKELKKMLGRQENNYKFILANVLAKPNLSPYDSLILDVGENYGVKKGDKVVVDDTVVIGELEEIYSKTAKVHLYSFPGESLNVAIGFNKIVGMAKGKGGGNFEVKFPKDVLFEEGDIVVLPSLNLFFLGVINKIIITPEDSLQTILFKIPINIFELKWVQIFQE